MNFIVFVWPTESRSRYAMGLGKRLSQVENVERRSPPQERFVAMNSIIVLRLNSLLILFLILFSLAHPQFECTDYSLYGFGLGKRAAPIEENSSTPQPIDQQNYDGYDRSMLSQNH